jgi:hypothetical protein
LLTCAPPSFPHEDILYFIFTKNGSGFLSRPGLRERAGITVSDTLQHQVWLDRVLPSAEMVRAGL